MSVGLALKDSYKLSPISNTHSHCLQVVLVALAQFAGNHGLGFAHVVDGALHGDDALEIEVVDVVDAAHGDLRVSVLHNFLDGGAALADDASNQIVVREDSQRDLAVGETKRSIRNKEGRIFFLFEDEKKPLLPFAQTVRLLLRDVHDLLASVRTVIRIAINSDGFLRGAETVLSVNVHPRARHLRDLAYGGSLTANYGSHHLRLHENTKREVRLTSGARHTGISDAGALAAASSSILRRRHFHF